MVTGSPVVTLTLVPTAQPKPSFRALWQGEADGLRSPSFPGIPGKRREGRSSALNGNGSIWQLLLQLCPLRTAPTSPHHPWDWMGLATPQTGHGTELQRLKQEEMCSTAPASLQGEGRSLPPARLTPSPRKLKVSVPEGG